MGKSAVRRGVHCWRWLSKQQRTWGLFGVSECRAHRDGSYSEQGVYGIASSGSYYANGQSRNDVAAHSMYDKAELMLDMKLDLNKGELVYMLVGDKEKKEMRIKGVERKTKDDKGYVPHISIYYKDTNVQIKKIPPAWFGKHPKKAK